jgi:hypothetical protein
VKGTTHRKLESFKERILGAFAWMGLGANVGGKRIDFVHWESKGRVLY